MTPPASAMLAPERAVPLRAGSASWLLPVRATFVAVSAMVLLVVLAVWDLSVGDVPLRFGEVMAVMLGQGDEGSRFIVTELRLPTTLTAVFVGMALGVSGAMTQTFARNPLASPDVLGINDGASLGAVAVIVIAGGSGYGGGLIAGNLQRIGVPLAALGGALLTAALLYVLSWRRGIDGQRLVLIGIGLGAALSALTSWLLVRSRIEDAQSAQVWLNGSLANRGWEHVLPVACALAVLVPVALLLVRDMNAMSLGDDSALGLGVRLDRTRLLVLLVAVGLAAVAVSSVGPLQFVAFVVPQVALRLTRGSRPPLVASMALGGCLVVAADLVVRVVLPFAVPAGLVTAVVGAPYLLYLVLCNNRRKSA